MAFFSNQIKIKSDDQRTYALHNVEITDEVLAIQKRSISALAVGGLVGIALAEAARKKNGITLIPLDQITAVETKTSAFTALVIVHAANRPALTLACTSKKEMETVAALLKRQ